MFKLIASDIDGTLIDSKGWLPQRNIDAIRKLTENGIYFLPATGRSDILAKDYLDELGINCPIVGCNGATIQNLYDNNPPEYIKSLTKEQLNSIFNLCDKHDIKSKAFTIDVCYTDSDYLLKGGIGLIVRKYTKPMSYSIKYEYTANMHTIADKPVLKCVVVDDNVAYVEEIRDRINTEIDGVTALKSNWNCIDIIRSDVSKGQAVIDYAASLGIKPEEIIAFGDSENDISMLKAVGMGIAVNNADEAVKAAADKLTLTNDEYGVASALKKIFPDILGQN